MEFDISASLACFISTQNTRTMSYDVARSRYLLTRNQCAYFFPAMRMWSRRGKGLFSASSTKSFFAGIISGLKAWSWHLYFRICRAQGPLCEEHWCRLCPEPSYTPEQSHTLVKADHKLIESYVVRHLRYE